MTTGRAVQGLLFTAYLLDKAHPNLNLKNSPDAQLFGGKLASKKYSPERITTTVQTMYKMLDSIESTLDKLRKAQSAEVANNLIGEVNSIAKDLIDSGDLIVKHHQNWGTE